MISYCNSKYDSTIHGWLHCMYTGLSVAQMYETNSRMNIYAGRRFTMYLDEQSNAIQLLRYDGMADDCVKYKSTHVEVYTLKKDNCMSVPLTKSSCICAADTVGNTAGSRDPLLVNGYDYNNFERQSPPPPTFYTMDEASVTVKEPFEPNEAIYRNCWMICNGYWKYHSNGIFLIGSHNYDVDTFELPIQYDDDRCDTDDGYTFTKQQSSDCYRIGKGKTAEEMLSSASGCLYTNHFCCLLWLTRGRTASPLPISMLDYPFRRTFDQ